MELKDLLIEPSWRNVLQDQFEAPYFLELQSRLSQFKNAGITIFPNEKNLFNAFELCPFNKAKVIILGQDPYHGEGQAHGLSFSVKSGVKLPPSLVNIFKELHADLQLPITKNGNLEHWAQQGVLLLNSILTVSAHQAASHHKLGWEKFTDAAIKSLSDKGDKLVFILWGTYAQSKTTLIDAHKHLVLSAAHPSPLSAYKGFFGCKHFSKTNVYLQQNGKKPIDWQLKVVA